jgi:leucyl-tRNA synthetase
MDQETILALANQGIGTDRTEKMTKSKNNSSVQLEVMILNADASQVRNFNREGGRS